MVVYHVRWERDDVLSKGTTKGRPKSKDYIYSFTVLCRGSKDAIAVLEYLFNHEWFLNKPVYIEDGKVTLQRVSLDSRHFEAQYLYMDEIKRPLSLLNLNRSLFDMFKYYHL